MNKIIIPTQRLAEVVAKNKEEHEKLYLAAIEGYKIALVEKLDELKARVLTGEVIDPYVGLQKPTHHLKDYNQILRVLELTSQPEVELSQQEFGNYVMDEWDLKAQFVTGATGYSGYTGKSGQAGSVNFAQ